MYQSKLFTLLKGLDPSELRWLHKFLKSPFYNSNQQYIQLFEYIKKYYPDLESPKLTKEAAHKKLFPKEQFEVQRMRKMMHELTVLVEDFMVAQHFHNNPQERKKVLTKELGRRNVYELFKKNVEEMSAELERQPYRNSEYFLEQFQLTQSHFGHPMTLREKDSAAKILAMTEDLDVFYFLQKLSMACVLESMKAIYSVEKQTLFFDGILAEIERRNLAETPLIKLYLLVYQLFRNKEQEKFFEKLSIEFLKEKDKLDIANREIILKYLINYTSFQLNRGKSEYVRKNFDLYKIGLNEDILMRNKRMSIATFVNIVTAAAFLKEIEWGKNFVEKHKIYLDSENRDEAVKMNMANLYFHEAQFEKVIELLRDVLFEKVLFKIMSRTLLLKSYFHLFLKDDSYYELIIAQIETFDRYIRREHKISEMSKTNFQNFGRWLKKLIHAYWLKEDRRIFQKEISTIDSVSNKAWLLEMS